MRSIVWTLAPRRAATFADDLVSVAMAVVGRSVNAAAWHGIADLAWEAAGAKTRSERLKIAAEAARRCRGWTAHPVQRRGLAVASWYRALALVMFAAARWHP